MNLYNRTRMCRLHPDQIAAVCSLCYNEALKAQDAQWYHSRVAAHKKYLSERGTISSTY